MDPLGAGANPPSTNEIADPDLDDVTAAQLAVDREVKHGGWPTPTTRVLRGKTLGIIGLGYVGRHVTKIANVNSGDELTYNAVDGQYYLVPSNSSPINRVLLQVDATTNTLQQSLPVTGLRNVASYMGNGHVYSVASRPAVGTVDTTPCAAFNVIGTGCVVVFGH